LFTALQIVSKALFDSEFFLVLSVPQDFFAATGVNIGRPHVADAFMVSALVLILNKLRHLSFECFRTSS
jgi:hypothetical protein